jgi:uncharacterized protein YjbI with pentapeptide repeats
VTPADYLGLGVLGLVVIAGLIAAACRREWQWTGLVDRSKEPPQRKTLWDWLQLLIVPLALASIGLWFNTRDDLHQQQRADADRALAVDNRRENALNAYLQQMSDLLRHDNLADAHYGDQSAILARTLTLTVLRRLDGYRKGAVINFLNEAGLFDTVDLHGADLSYAVLRGVALYHVFLPVSDFHGADFAGAHLSRVVFFGDNLRDARFRRSQLKRVNFTKADLRDADFSHAHIVDSSFATSCLTRANFYGVFALSPDCQNAAGREMDFRKVLFPGKVKLAGAQFWDSKTSSGGSSLPLPPKLAPQPVLAKRHCL